MTTSNGYWQADERQIRLESAHRDRHEGLPWPFGVVSGAEVQDAIA
jgi:hypothetical protein